MYFGVLQLALHTQYYFDYVTILQTLEFLLKENEKLNTQINAMKKYDKKLQEQFDELNSNK